MRRRFARTAAHLLAAAACFSLGSFLAGLNTSFGGRRGDCAVAGGGGAHQAASAPRHVLVVLIVSGAKNHGRRTAIRETWLNVHSRGARAEFRHFFAVGTSGLGGTGLLGDLEEEQAAHGDLLLLADVDDGFSHLTDKVVASFVRLVEAVSFEYLMKVDDDTFVRVPEVLDELRDSNYKGSPLYWGYMDGRAPVFKTGKWAEPRFVLCDRYLPYALGGGYVLSADLVAFVARNAAHLQRYVNEDVSVGTWLAALKVNRVHDVRFDTEHRSRGCSNRHLVSHKQSVEEMRAKQYSLDSVGVLCEREEVLVRPYEYDWSKPPSQCCKRPQL